MWRIHTSLLLLFLWVSSWAFCSGSQSPLRGVPERLSEIGAAVNNGLTFDDPSPLLNLHRQLVQIESISGHELAVGNFLVDYLSERNFTVETHPVAPDRFNVFAYLGTRRTTRLLVTSHMDTVPPFIPYEIRGGQIWGRGSADAKGCLAAQIAAVQRLRATGQLDEGDVALLFVVAEETTGSGMRTANAMHLSWEAVVFGEPTGRMLATGHKGFLAWKVKAHGKSAHSGYPHLGINANSLLVAALAKLDSMKLPHSERFGNTTLNIGRIDGGVAANVIPAYAEAELAMRLAGGTIQEARELVVRTVQEVDERLEVEFLAAGYAPASTQPL
ncbi:MAG: hypothetical protein M1838_001564 [Thelocarpon superellum]|nr:MAG: hypothetical protein M1838_001564 [Thelocarpon superellum]